jgi:hypothetical protein
MSQNIAELRDIAHRTSLLARERGWTPDQANAVNHRVGALFEWLLVLRRAFFICRDHPSDHPSSRSAIAELHAHTTRYLGTFSLLDIMLRPDHAYAPEGIALIEPGDSNGYLLHPFFRDGVLRLTLMPGITAAELQGIIDTLRQSGAATEEDSITLLWYARFRHVRYEVDATFSPRNVTAMLAANPNDPVVGAYVSALAAAGVRFAGVDRRAPFTRDRAAELGALDLNPTNVSALLDAPVLDRWFTSFDPEHRATIRALFEDPHDRDYRLRTLTSLGTPTGDPDDVL